ncbi:hypothetical protein C7M84_003060 [Penaeus vannamei]|uniref:Uncharacterized protein n=1 Tax=Penaeus vannamei TaxID=6689 RepID=A0A3R7P875_PENVA|nr:hypothetical protein C7M84_003060 [Penaeus vannamei]
MRASVSAGPRERLVEAGLRRLERESSVSRRPWKRLSSAHAKRITGRRRMGLEKGARGVGRNAADQRRGHSRSNNAWHFISLALMVQGAWHFEGLSLVKRPQPSRRTYRPTCSSLFSTVLQDDEQRRGREGSLRRGDQKQTLAFRYAVESVNHDHGLRKTSLRPIIETIPPYDSFYASKRDKNPNCTANTRVESPRVEPAVSNPLSSQLQSPTVQLLIPIESRLTSNSLVVPNNPESESVTARQGTTRVEWPLTSVQRVCVATGGEVEDEGKIFIIQTRPCHPCGEAYLYFFSPELSSLLEGLHEAVSKLISASAADDVSLISDLSELSGALSSVVVLPQRLPDPPKMRKSTSVIDLAQIHELQPLCNIHTPTRLSSSQCNLAEELRGEPPLPGRLLGHSRRRSMSETNLAKLCLDETDEELESRDDDLEDADLRQADLPKDRTSSSGSYNSYRSTDSGVRLSASPSTHCDGGRYMSENAARRFVTKSDSIDSGVRTKDENREVAAEGDEAKKADPQAGDGKQESSSRRGMSALEEEPDVETKVGAWCLQSARARKSFFAKNLNVTCAAHKERKKGSLSRTMSESYKEVTDKHDEFRRLSEFTTSSKACTVYEEIVDVLKPLTQANQQAKEHDYEELDKCRRDIKRSYSFQEKTKPPPLPPRRPKSFSPDPWAEEALSKSGTLKKIFGLSFQSKSHSTESMLDVSSGYDDLSTLGSEDMAMVQALGTLPRVKKKPVDRRERQSSRSASPKMSPKQKGQRTPSTDSSLADASTPETPQQQQQQQQQQACQHRQYWRPEASSGPPGEPPDANLSTKFPNSYSMDSFAVDKGSQSCGTPVRDTDSDWADADVVPGSRLRSIPLRKLSSPQPPTDPSLWRDEGDCWKECDSRLLPGGFPPPPREPPPPPAPHEPHYANLPHHTHDQDYMSMDEVRGAYRRISSASVGEARRDSGGYLSMGEIRSFRAGDTPDCPGCSHAPGSITHHDCHPEREAMPEDHEYMTMDDIQTVLHTEFPGIYSSKEEKELYKHCGYKSAPASRKTSYSEGSDYLTPQEVGRMIRREVLAIRRGGREATPPSEDKPRPLDATLAHSAQRRLWTLTILWP